jgi:hypothetical protein
MNMAWRLDNLKMMEGFCGEGQALSAPLLAATIAFTGH